MRYHILAAACIWLSGLPAAAGDDLKKELAKLEGTWTLTRMESSGKSLLEKNEPTHRFVIKSGKLTSKAKQAGEKEHDLSKYIDATKKPMAVTIPVEMTVRFYGIFEVTGNELRLCGDLVDTAQEKKPESRRPKEFDSNKGLLLVFKREKAVTPKNDAHRRDDALSSELDAKLDVCVSRLLACLAAYPLVPWRS
jgi:uncharacterized protein (TIGR03067 family)